MDSLLPLAIGLGAAAGGAILLLAARRLSIALTGRKPRPGFSPGANKTPGETAAGAVVIVQTGGQIKYMNSAARFIFNLQPEEIPNLERLARRVRPPKEFIRICSSESTARFSINGRLLEASSYSIPFAPASLTLIALRDADSILGVESNALAPAGHTLRSISELSQTIASSLDIETTLQGIFQAIQKLIPADSIHVSVWDAANQHLTSYTLAGITAGEDILLKSESPLEGDNLGSWMIANRQPVLLQDSSSESLPAASELQIAGMRSLLALPMFVGKDPAGTLELGSLQPACYRPEHLELLQLVAGQAAIALRNAILYQNEQKRTAELSALAQLTQSIGNLDNLDDLFNRLVNSIIPLVGVSTIGFLVCSEDLNSLDCQTIFQGLPDSPFQVASLAPSIQLDKQTIKTLLSQDVLISEDAANDTQWEMLGLSSLASQLNLRDAVLAPLVSGGEPIGYLLAANHNEAGSTFSKDEIHLLLIIANQAAPIVENARLVEQARQRASSAEALRRIASLAASDASLDEILINSLQELASLTQSDVAAVLLMDNSRSRLVLHTPSLHGLTEPIEEWITEVHSHNPLFNSTVTQTRQTLFIDNVGEQNPTFQVYMPLLRSIQIESGLIVPLVARDQGIGELLLGCRARHSFDQNEIQLITTAGAQLAGVVERSRLFSQTDESLRRRVEQLTALTSITRELNTSLDPRYLLELVYQEALRTTGASCGSILLLDFAKSRPAGRFMVQYSVGDTHSPDLSDIEEHVIKTAETLNVADFAATPWLPGHMGVGSALLVPISYQEKIAGLIHLHSDALGFFDQTAVEITEALSVQAAAVLNNALQYQEQIRRGKILDRQAQTLAYLSDTVQEIRQGQSLEDSLAAVARAIREAALYQVVLISVYQPADGTLRRVYAEGISEDLWEELRAHTHPWRSVLQMLQPQYRIHNSYFIPIEQEPIVPEDIHMVTILPSATRQEEDAWDPDDMLAVPLYSDDGSPLGLITVDVPLDGRRPDRQTIETVEVLATQAAVTIENYRRSHNLSSKLNNVLNENEELHTTLKTEINRRQMETHIQAETSRKMNVPGVGPILENLLNSTLQILPPAQAGFVVTWDLKTLCLAPRVAHGYPDYTSLLQIHYPVGGTETGQSALVQVFLRGQSRRCDHADYQQCYHFTPEDSLVYRLALGDKLPRSCMFIPIRSGDTNLGVLVLDNFEDDNGFTGYDETLALSLAQQAAMAIEKDRLYQSAEQRSRQLHALTQVAGTLTFSMESQVLIDSALDQLAILVPYDHSELWLAVGDSFELSSGRGAGKAYLSPLDPPVTRANHLILEASQTGQPILISDTTQDDRLEKKENVPAGSWLGLPLLAKGELIGLVAVIKDEADYYTSEHVQLAQAFAGQVSIALENSRLFAETRSLTEQLEVRVEERTSELREQVELNETLLKIMTELSASLDIDQVLVRTLKVINEASGAEESVILLKQGGNLQVSSRQGTKPLEPGLVQTEISILERLACEWVAANRKPLAIADTEYTQSLAGIPDNTPHHSLIAVPLVHSEEALGVFQLLHSNPGAFTPRHLELAEAAARQISVALKNSELFSVIRDQAENMGSLLRAQQIAASRSQAILEAVADGVIVSDDSNRISFFNSSAERILSLKAAQVLGKDIASFTSLIGKASEPWGLKIEEWSQKAATLNPVDSYQNRLTLENGQVAGIHLSPVVWRGSFLGTVSILRDITAEVMVDRMKSDFVANVSHELRTPMTSIKGYVEVLLLGAAGTLNEQQIQSLQVVRNNTERLGLLVDDLLDVSRIEAGRVTLNIEPLDLTPLCEDVVNEIRRRSRSEGKPMEVNLIDDADSPRVNGDRQRLRQVFNNLAGNAFHYTPSGGKIDLHLYRQGSDIVVDIIDNGIGILPQHQVRLFERFYRGDDPLVLASPGTGLGLSIVKSLVEMHNGRIWFTSTGKRGEGTIFSVTLPGLEDKS